METKLNIAKILKGKPINTKLYDLVRDINVYLTNNPDSCNGVYYTFVKNGIQKLRYSSKGTLVGFENGMIVLAPSKSMQDWSKFAWKKGDVLVSNDSTTKVIFNGWKDDTYTLFRGAYALITHNDGKVEFGSDSLIFETCNYKGIEVEDAAQCYINCIEKRLGGKLNLETLEIDKPEFKDGDILCVIANSTDYHYILIYEGQDDEHIYRYVTMLENHSLILKKGSYFTKPKDYSMRYATDEEKQQLFDALAKEGKTWDAEKKEVVDLKPKWTPKPFDRVITRVDDDAIWTANIFSHIDQYGEYVTIGCESGYTYCLPYNEETAKLIGTTKDVED